MVLKIPHESSSYLERRSLHPFAAFHPDKWNTATYLAQRLETMGVKHFFTVPGLSFITELESSGLANVHSR